ncbi:hypothetical protein IW261DRAFT_1003123 [Armillaria novae-zelandiae]|uniref:Uncharacterized protein n=1 Tax=Armillaria novae-zelandiae TaxID=153914 RepID=A0AA39NRS2_9AGAR|nr:hypothetical protein IW261DRAFT_1003123 [Armillaria novae-zelandiae]
MYSPISLSLLASFVNLLVDGPHVPHESSSSQLYLFGCRIAVNLTLSEILVGDTLPPVRKWDNPVLGRFRDPPVNGESTIPLGFYHFWTLEEMVQPLC